MKKATTDGHEYAAPAHAVTGYVAFGIALVLLAASYMLSPAAVTFTDAAPWFSWQLDKDTIPLISRTRTGSVMVAMVLFTLATVVSVWELAPRLATLPGTQAAVWNRRMLWWAWASLSLPIAMHMLAAWYAADVMGGSILGTYEPDSWTRLTLVRDWLSGGNWYDHALHRNNAPFEAIPNHWTRPLDLIIALVVKLQGDTSLNTALIRAAIFLPWLWTCLLLLGLLRLAGRFGHAVATPLILVACLVCDHAFWDYFMIGNADHHAPLGALFIWVVVLLTGTPTPRRTCVAGLLLALMIWISPEALVLAGGFYLYFGIRWLRWPARANPLTALTAVTALGVTLAVLLERPPSAWLVPVYDTLSIVHALLLLLCAGLAQCLTVLFPNRGFRYRVLVAWVGCAIVAAVQWAVCPLFFAGPMAEADAFIKQHFLPTIFETQPLWTRPPALLLAILWRPLLAIIAGLWVWRRDPAFALPLFMVLVTQLLFVLQFRWAYYAYPLAAAVLAAGFGRLLVGEKGVGTGISQSVMPLTLLAALEVPLLLFNTVPLFTPWMERALASTRQAHQWMQQGALDRLDGDRSLVMLAPTAIGSQLLFWTPHRIIASNYHREGPGISYIWNVDAVSSEAELREYLRQRKVDALLLCFGSFEGGLPDRLRRGDVEIPHWLERVKLATTVPAESAPALFLVRP